MRVQVPSTRLRRDSLSAHSEKAQSLWAEAINIFGVWEPELHFDYALTIGTLKAPTYVELMEWQATIARQHFDATGQIMLIVQDNASVHRSQSAQKQVERWQNLILDYNASFYLNSPITPI